MPRWHHISAVSTSKQYIHNNRLSYWWQTMHKLQLKSRHRSKYCFLWLTNKSIFCLRSTDQESVRGNGRCDNWSRCLLIAHVWISLETNFSEQGWVVVFRGVCKDFAIRVRNRWVRRIDMTWYVIIFQDSSEYCIPHWWTTIRHNKVPFKHCKIEHSRIVEI